MRLKSVRLASAVLLAAATFPAVAFADVITETLDTSENAPPWEGSALNYTQDLSAISLRRGAEPDYNPYYSHTFEFAPRWRLSQNFFVRSSVAVGQEITTADDTNSRNEIVVSDIPVDLGWLGWVEPNSGLRLAGDMRVVAPISKVARAQSRVFSFGPSLSLSREFPVLAGLTLRYDARYSERFHRYSTTQFEGPTISNCSGLADCEELTQTGRRNIRRMVAHGPLLSLSPRKGLAFSTRFQMAHGYLYGLSDAGEFAGSRGLNDGREDANVRHRWGFEVGAEWDVLKSLSISSTVGTNAVTGAATIGPDGQRQSPFFNRYTMVGVGLSLRLDEVLPKP